MPTAIHIMRRRGWAGADERSGGRVRIALCSCQPDGAGVGRIALCSCQPDGAGVGRIALCSCQPDGWPGAWAERSGALELLPVQADGAEEGPSAPGSCQADGAGEGPIALDSCQPAGAGDGAIALGSCQPAPASSGSGPVRKPSSMSSES